MYGRTLRHQSQFLLKENWKNQNDGRFTDLVFILDKKKKLEGHSFVLANFSGLIFKIVRFKRNIPCEKLYISVTNIKMETFRVFIEFIYTGTVILNTEEECSEFEQVARLFEIHNVTATKSIEYNRFDLGPSEPENENTNLEKQSNTPQQELNNKSLNIQKRQVASEDSLSDSEIESSNVMDVSVCSEKEAATNELPNIQEDISKLKHCHIPLQRIDENWDKWHNDDEVVNTEPNNSGSEMTKLNEKERDATMVKEQKDVGRNNSDITDTIQKYDNNIVDEIEQDPLALDADTTGENQYIDAPSDNEQKHNENRICEIIDTNVKDSLTDNEGTTVPPNKKRRLNYRTNKITFTCFCKQIFSIPSLYKRHIVRVHFYDQLLKDYKYDADQTDFPCSLCKEVYTNRGSVIDHIALDHHKIFDYCDIITKAHLLPLFEEPLPNDMPKEEIGETSNIPMSEDKCNKNTEEKPRRETEKVELSTEDITISLEAKCNDTVDDTNRNETKYDIIECGYCDGPFSSIYNYLKHLSLYHFKEDIREKFPDMFIEHKTPCKFCSAVPMYKSSMVLHLGIAHRKVTELIPEEMLKSFQKFEQYKLEERRKKIIIACPKSISNKKTGNKKRKINLSLSIDKNTIVCISTSNPKKRSITCLICNKVMHTSREFLNHLSDIHYKKKIHAKYPELFKNAVTKCKLCERQLTSRMAMYRHIGVKHKIINELMSPELKAKIRSFELKKKEDHKLPFSTFKPGSLTCYICNEKTLTYNSLLSHLSDVHFSKELIRKYPELFQFTPTKCNWCELVLENNQSNQIVRHIGSQHGKVLEFTNPLFPKSQTFCKKFDKNIIDCDVSEKVLVTTTKKGRKSITCLICSKKNPIFFKCHEFLRHISCVHFRHKLEEKYPEFFGNQKNQSIQCTLCDAIPKYRLSMAGHIGGKHRKVLEFLPHGLIEKLKYFDLKFSPDNQQLTEKPDQHRNKETLAENSGINSIECDHCSRLFSTVSAFLTHMSSAHYNYDLKVNYQEIFAVTGPQGLYKCKWCSYIVDKPTAMVVHMGAKHRKVVQFMTPDLQMKLKIFDPSHYEDEDSIGGPLHCEYCEHSFGKNVVLFLWHLSQVHFVNQLKELYGHKFDPNGGNCKWCSYKVDNQNDFLNHIAVTHRKVEKFVSPEIAEKIESVGKTTMKASPAITHDISSIIVSPEQNNSASIPKSSSIKNYSEVSLDKKEPVMKNDGNLNDKVVSPSQHVHNEKDVTKDIGNDNKVTSESCTQNKVSKESDILASQNLVSHESEQCISNIQALPDKPKFDQATQNKLLQNDVTIASEIRTSKSFQCVSNETKLNQDKNIPAKAVKDQTSVNLKRKTLAAYNSASKKTKVFVKCLYCKEEFDNKSAYLEHQIKSHFLREFQRQYVNLFNLSQGQCQSCSCKIENVLTFYVHMGVKHNTHKQLMPKETITNSNLFDNIHFTKSLLHKISYAPSESESSNKRHSTLICDYCSFPLQSKQDFLTHQVKTHFKQQFENRYKSVFQINKGHCQLCPYKSEEMQEYLIHLGGNHRKACEFLPQSIIQRVVESGGGKHFVCMCDKEVTYKSYFKFKTHLFRYHYELNVEADYSNCGTICPICEMIFSEHSSLIGHIGIAHDKVLDYCNQEILDQLIENDVLPKHKKSEKVILNSEESGYQSITEKTDPFHGFESEKVEDLSNDKVYSLIESLILNEGNDNVDTAGYEKEIEQFMKQSKSAEDQTEKLLASKQNDLLHLEENQQSEISNLKGLHRNVEGSNKSEKNSESNKHLGLGSINGESCLIVDNKIGGNSKVSNPTINEKNHQNKHTEASEDSKENVFTRTARLLGNIQSESLLGNESHLAEHGNLAQSDNIDCLKVTEKTDKFDKQSNTPKDSEDNIFTQTARLLCNVQNESYVDNGTQIPEYSQLTNSEQIDSNISEEKTNMLSNQPKALNILRKLSKANEDSEDNIFTRTAKLIGKEQSEVLLSESNQMIEGSRTNDSEDNIFTRTAKLIGKDQSESLLGKSKMIEQSKTNEDSEDNIFTRTARLIGKEHLESLLGKGSQMTEISRLTNQSKIQKDFEENDVTQAPRLLGKIQCDSNLHASSFLIENSLLTNNDTNASSSSDTQLAMTTNSENNISSLVSNINNGNLLDKAMDDIINSSEETKKENDTEVHRTQSSIYDNVSFLSSVDLEGTDIAIIEVDSENVKVEDFINDPNSIGGTNGEEMFITLQDTQTSINDSSNDVTEKDPLAQEIGNDPIMIEEPASAFVFHNNSEETEAIPEGVHQQSSGKSNSTINENEGSVKEF